MLRNNLRQVVYSYVPLSPSSITWYRPKGGDALRLRRQLQAWRKVMAAYRRVDDLVSPAGWLPVHRDQLRAQRSVSSMGSLYLLPLVEAASLHARGREHTVSALVKFDTRVTLASVGLFVVEGMDSGRRTFVLHHPGAGEDNFTAVRGSALSPPSMFPLLSPVDDASRVDDFLRPDIDWTIKYLASDQPRSPTFTASRRLAQTSEWRKLY